MATKWKEQYKKSSFKCFMSLITTTTDELTELLNLFLPIMVVKNKQTISDQLAIFISAMFNGLFFTKTKKKKTKPKHVLLGLS